jgi:Divergent InlB B-repeat domain/IPTL-CTERM motif
MAPAGTPHRALPISPHRIHDRNRKPTHMMSSPRQTFAQPSRLRALLHALLLLVATSLGIVAATPARSQTAIFTLQDRTNLVPGTYQIYVTGFSTAGPYALQSDGSWAAPPPPTPANAITTLPCYRFPQDITQVQINGTQTAISARVYYFIVTDKVRFPSCNPTSGTGLFNQQGVTNAFIYTLPTLNLTTPTVGNVTATNFPAWSFSEIGTSATVGTIDLSQVDFLSFPMNTVASVTPGTNPPNPTVIGNPVGAADNPGDAVNYTSILDSYRKFINGLAQAKNGNRTCFTDSSPIECAYLDLLQQVSAAGSPLPQFVVQNPGGFLGQNTPATQASRLNTVFDAVITTLWTATIPPTVLALDTGGALGGTAGPPVVPSIAQDVFTSQIVTMDYPGSVPAYPVRALQFTGTNTGYIAYVFSPIDYQAGCAASSIPNCSAPASSGYQVFAGAGTLGAPGAGTYAALLAAGRLSSSASTYGSLGYDAVVTRLGFLISGAMNRGVALVPCTKTYTWQCWQDETYWYPTTLSATFPNLTQNLFSQWMHTASIGATPMFKQPQGAVRSASGTPGGGTLMGMAYGFSNDENPTPPATSPPQPQVPSKLDQTVVLGGSGPYTITFGPWFTLSTLAVTTTGQGTVTSAPAGINCGSTCSQSYPLGTLVVLTASPSPGWIFQGWTGACTGGSTTCSVTVNAPTFANAVFVSTAGIALNVVVTGNGTVTSVPAGINCGTACSTSFAANTPVTLTATTVPGWTFAGWSGACAGLSVTCSITMSQAQNVGASFVANSQFTLTVTGAAGGIVTTTPGAINCGTTCAAGFAAGTVVNVVARPNAGYQFTGWSGACTGTNTCDLTMSTNRAVQASFAPVTTGQYALTVHDFGEGTIVSSPAGISCGVTCSAVFAAGTAVTLVATPVQGYQFAGWSGACSGTGPCVVLMNNIQDVDATFLPAAGPGVSIPTLSEWMLLLLSLLIALVACWQWRTGGARLRR